MKNVLLEVLPDWVSLKFNILVTIKRFET